ncbi:hypothetical protein M0811_13210 [Anaeramoeba ignava]|uniref:USP domain-containing protein n=1 Tax=Anaeramoeba ignava TaxID=1746090 RepID=A0A9Q0L6G6_ANAIG|nr:hypothetical protein M0811_13210 [Anaeramoeba ignava]
MPRYELKFMIENEFSEENISKKDIDYKCETCEILKQYNLRQNEKHNKNPDSILQKYEVRSFPHFFCFQIKRFVYDFRKKQTIKIEDPVQIPQELDLSSFKTLDCKENHFKYRLRAFIYHLEKEDYKHYISFIFSEKNNYWIKCNDSQVTTEKNPKELKYGYLYFYEKQIGNEKKISSSSNSNLKEKENKLSQKKGKKTNQQSQIEQDIEEKNPKSEIGKREEKSGTKKPKQKLTNFQTLNSSNLQDFFNLLQK